MVAIQYVMTQEDHDNLVSIFTEIICACKDDNIDPSDIINSARVGLFVLGED